MLSENSYYNKELLRDNLEDNLDYYDFIEDIMDEKIIHPEERQLFWEVFGEKYYNDVDFRYRNHGKYILFHKNKYIGIVQSVEEARILYSEKGRKLTYIGDNNRLR